MAYSGKFSPKNKSKYEGNHTNIQFRSLWERALMRWCDENPDVLAWSSEEVVIPYISPLDGRPHRYFMDFKVIFKSGSTLLIEVKPEYQTKPPQKNKNMRKARYLAESETFAVNDAKWNAAKKYADKKGWKFVIFTETTLNAMGLKVTQNRYKKKANNR